MAKVFMGTRLRSLREDRGLTQARLAQMLGISPSYLNQIERNQRALTVPVLVRLNAALGLDVQLFDAGDSGLLAQELRAALADQGLSVPPATLRALTFDLPDVAEAILTLHKRLREVGERADLLAQRVSGGASLPNPPTAFEAVRDWFAARRNHVAMLDEAGEALGDSLMRDGLEAGLAARLAGRHGVQAVLHEASDPVRLFDPARRCLHLARHLSPGQRAFQMATQLAALEQGDAIERLVAEAGLDVEGAAQLRIGLCNYFAGAVTLPYRAFLDVAEAESYDIERIARRFGVGFETACHRLSTLQRPGASGVPFFFIRVDRAGNISKRQSATDFHFSRVGGACPLWTVYEAFARPGEVLTQLAEMPDGRRYLWITRTVDHGPGGFGAPRKRFAVAVGCDIAHAGRTIYGRDPDIAEARRIARIGPGCKLCDRPDCHQRAFPMAGRPLAADPRRRSLIPYAPGDAGPPPAP